VTLDGWALCLDEIESLTVWSETPDSQNGGEPVRQKVGAAAFLDTPPCDEVQAVKYRRYPCRDRSNWHFEADRRQLPGDGRGVSLQVVARNAATGVDTMIGVVDLV
jgi:hypothetical protein